MIDVYTLKPEDCLLVDNSSLSKALDSETVLLNFAEFLKKEKMCALVSLDTIEEVLGGEDMAAVSLRLNRMNDLLRFNGRQNFKITSSCPVWIEKEKRKKGRLDSVPLLENSPKWTRWLKLFSYAENELKEYKIDLCKGVGDPLGKNHKNLMLEHDKKFRIKIKSLIDTGVISKESVGFPDEILFDEVADLSDRLGQLSRKKLKKFFNSRNKYYYAIQRLKIIRYKIILNGLPSNKYLCENRKAWKIKRGDWTDIRLTIQASKMRYLVTQDEGLMSFSSLLKSRGVVSFTPINLYKLFGA